MPKRKLGFLRGLRDDMGKTFLRYLGLEGEWTKEMLIAHLAMRKIKPYYDPSQDNVLFKPRQSPSFSKTLRRELNLRTKEDCERIKKEIKQLK